MPEAIPAAPAAVPPPPPAPVAAAPAAPAASAPPPPAAAAPAVAPAAEPAKPAAAAPAPAAQPAAPEVKPAVAPATVAAPVEGDFKLPDGAKYEPKAIDEVKALAKEHGIPAKAVEAFFALDQKWLKTNNEAAQKAFLQKVEDQAKADIEALKTDKEFGGALYDKTVEAARSAEQQFFGEDFAKLMKDSGLQNHPAVVKGLARIRKAIAEDTTSSRAPGTQPPVVAPQKHMTRHERAKQRYLPTK